MEKRIYISCNSLPNTERSLKNLYENIYESDLKNAKIFLIHDSKFKLRNLNYYGLDIEYILSRDNGYEYPALHKLWEDSQENHFYGLYLHCKGSSKTEEEVFQRDLIWMDCMLYGLLKNVDTCFHYLNAGADLVGSMWYRHFKGNFFWFKSDYIKHMISPLNMLDLKTPEGKRWYSRYDAEYWCCYAYWYGLQSPLPYPKVKNLFYIDKDFSNYKNLTPALLEKYVCGNLTFQIENNLYNIFNEINLTEDEYEKFSNILFKYMDFDCVIKIKKV
jgi:hypothetical protein